MISLAAILKAAGSLTGWMLIVAQSAQAAAGDGMFPRAFSVTNEHGMPVRNLIITGVMMTGLLMLTMSPDVATQFYRITNATVVLMSIPYIYSVVSMWRLNATLDMPVAKRRVLIGIGVVAALFCVGVVVGQPAELNQKALMVLLLITPLYALIRHPVAPLATTSKTNPGSMRRE